MRPAIAGLVLTAAIAGGCGLFDRPELVVHNRTTVPILAIDPGAPTDSVPILLGPCESGRYTFGGPRTSGWTRVDPPADGQPDIRDAVIVTIQAMPPPDSSFGGAVWIVTDSGDSDLEPDVALPPCRGVPPTPSPPIE